MKADFVVLITGGAQGIGKGITTSLLEQNATVIIVDSDAKAGLEAKKALKPFGNIDFIHGDVAKENDVKKITHYIQKNYGYLHGLINNAGIMIRKPLQKLSLVEWHKVINVNLTSIFLFAKYTEKFLRKTSGVIINIASTRALMSEPNTESYAASKGGIVSLTHALAISLGPHIRVNCISPGWIEVSDWQKQQKRHAPHHSKDDKDQHPAGRVGKPQDIASMVSYLLSEQASFITGANFIIDGGMTRKMIYV